MMQNCQGSSVPSAGCCITGVDAGGPATSEPGAAPAWNSPVPEVIYTDEGAGLTLTRLEDLQRMGRYKLEERQRLWMLDLAGGIGTSLMGVLEAKAEFKVESYRMCEVDPVSRGVVLANQGKYRDCYPGRLGLGTFAEVDALPQDLFVLSRVAEDVFRDMEELPNLVFATVPCTEGSVAGQGRGATTHRGQLFRHAATVVGKLLEDYARRGLGGEGQLAPCGWMFETAPMRTEGKGGAVARMKEAYSAALGERTWDDAGKKGGTSRRLTEMYTNLGAAEDWRTLSTRGLRLPKVPIESLLRPGEQLQVWDDAKHGKAVWPNVHGVRLRVWPKFMRSQGSHQFRAVRKRKAPGGAPQWDMAVGVSMWKGSPHVPSAEMEEKAMGLWQGYTAATLCEGRARFLYPDERLARLGDLWERNLITATMDDRVASGASLQKREPQGATEADPPGCREALAHTARLGRTTQADERPEDPHEVDRGEDRLGEPEPWEERDQGYQDELGCGDEPEWELETEYVDYKPLQILPPGRSDRVKKPPTSVRRALEAGSPEEKRARVQLGKVLRWIEARRARAEPPREASLSDEEFAGYINRELSNDPECFQPGNIHVYRKVWREYLEETLGVAGVKKHNKIQALFRLLEKGVEPDWAPMDRADH